MASDSLKPESNGKNMIENGLLAMTVLTEGTMPTNKATKANLDSWIGRVPTYHTATLDSVDPQPVLEDFFGVPRDYFVVVDLATMEVLDVIAANPRGALQLVRDKLGL